MSKTTPHKLVIVPEHTRRGKKVKQHIRRVPQSPPPIVDVQPGVSGNVSAGLR